MTTRAKKFLFISGFILIAYSVIGFLLIPYVARVQIQKQIQSIYGVQAEIEKIYFNPFSFEVELKNLLIPTHASSEANKNRLRVGRFYLNLELSPLFKKELRFKSFYLGETSGDFIVLSESLTNWTPQMPLAEKSNEVENPQQASSKPWVLTLVDLQIFNTNINLSDRTLKEAFNLPLGPIYLQARNISTSIGEKTALEKLEITFGNGGFMQVAGSASLQPLVADINLKINGLALDFLTPYLLESTYLVLNQGTLNFSGNIQYQNGQVKVLSNIQVEKFRALHEPSQTPAIAWSSLDLIDLNFQNKPFEISIGEAVLKGLDTKILLKKNGQLNYSEYLRKKSSTKPDQQTQYKFEMRKLRIESGRLHFSDQQIKPNFNAQIDRIQGQIWPLTMSPNVKMNVDLKGHVEAQGQFRSKGFVIAHPKRPQLNLDLNFNNIEMTTFTPYAGEFAGYEISKGKLFLNLNYSLQNQYIRGQNKAILDQFTLGKAVESKNSTNLPVKLALALLKDRQGQIKINLPVEGDVNSPRFSFNEMIWTALKNMIVNIVAAPFDFLKSALGGGDNLDLISFDVGSMLITEPEKNKLSQLAEALRDRPNLSLEIQGVYQLAEALAMKPDSQINEKAEQELKELALKRAQTIQNYLVEKQIEAERLYILATTKIDQDAKPPRVVLLLKSRE